MIIEPATKEVSGNRRLTGRSTGAAAPLMRYGFIAKNESQFEDIEFNIQYMHLCM
jgi:hypothetical protein